MANAVLDMATELWKRSGATSIPWQGEATNVGQKAEAAGPVQQGEVVTNKANSDVYSSKRNPSKKAGFPVYTPYDGGYAVDYDMPYAEPSGDTGGVDSNKSTQGNNAETVGNVSDDTKRIVGNFLDKNIFGGLSEAANPGASLS